jgi:hypothetical protein
MLVKKARLYCTCEVRCHGGTWRSRAVFYRHKKYQHQLLVAIPSESDGSGSESDGASSSSDTSDVLPEDLADDDTDLFHTGQDSPPRKKRKLDNNNEGSDSSDIDDIVVRYRINFIYYLST